MRTDVFELHVQFKVMKFYFQVFPYFQKTEVYLEPIQRPKMELFVKIVDSLMPLTTLRSLKTSATLINFEKIVHPEHSYSTPLVC